MSEPNEALLDEHLAAENAHDLDRIMATYGAAPAIGLNGSRIEGLAAVREFHLAFGLGGGDQASFSDVHVAERRRHRTDDAIVIEQTITAVHTGSWRGVAPTGRQVSISVCTVYGFEAGKLAQENVYLDEGRLRHLLTTPGGDQPFASSRDVILRTEAFDAAVRFYGDVLGLRKTLDQKKDCLVAAGGVVVVEENPAVPRCYVRDPFGLVFNLERR